MLDVLVSLLSNIHMSYGFICYDCISYAFPIMSRCKHRSHHIVEDNLEVSNGKYVPNHRADFRFGQSTVGSKKEGAKARKYDEFTCHYYNCFSIISPSFDLICTFNSLVDPCIIGSSG